MFGNRRHYSFIAVALLTLPVCAGNDQCGYLPVVGPSPLRFIAPLALPVKAFIPPPPPAPEPPKPVKLEIPAPPPPPAAVVPDPAAITNQVSSLSQPVQPEEVVSPQMLLKYFNKSSSSNGVSATVVAPLDFTPPKPADALSSKATYTIGP